MKTTMEKASHQEKALFLAEIHTALRILPHVNIVAALGYIDDGTPALLMEYVKGGTLKEHPKFTTKGFSKTERLELTLGIAKGMAHLTSNGVVHRYEKRREDEV